MTFDEARKELFDDLDDWYDNVKEVLIDESDRESLRSALKGFSKTVNKINNLNEIELEIL